MTKKKRAHIKLLQHSIIIILNKLDQEYVWNIDGELQYHILEYYISDSEREEINIKIGS